MGLTSANMVSKYKAKLTALGVTFNHAQSETFINALFEAIVEDIQENAVVQTTSGAPNGEHTGNVT